MDDLDSVQFTKFSEIDEEALKELHGNDDIGITALMYAATQRDATSLLEMLASGYAEASLFVKDKKGRTALVFKSKIVPYSRTLYIVTISKFILGLG